MDEENAATSFADVNACGQGVADSVDYDWLDQATKFHKGNFHFVKSGFKAEIQPKQQQAIRCVVGLSEPDSATSEQRNTTLKVKQQQACC